MPVTTILSTAPGLDVGRVQNTPTIVRKCWWSKCKENAHGSPYPFPPEQFPEYLASFPGKSPLLPQSTQAWQTRCLHPFRYWKAGIGQPAQQLSNASEHLGCKSGGGHLPPPRLPCLINVAFGIARGVRDENFGTEEIEMVVAKVKWSRIAKSKTDWQGNRWEKFQNKWKWQYWLNFSIYGNYLQTCSLCVKLLFSCLYCKVRVTTWLLSLFSVLFIIWKVECVLHVFGEVKGLGMEWELQGLKCFHEFWINAVSTGGACLLARGEEPLTGNGRCLYWEDVHCEPKEVWEPSLGSLYRQVRDLHSGKKIHVPSNTEGDHTKWHEPLTLKPEWRS